jgi:hypothetical protein
MIEIIFNIIFEIPIPNPTNKFVGDDFGGEIFGR